MRVVELHKPKYQIVPVSQKAETTLRTAQAWCAQVGYLYARSNESRSNNIEGQDYVVFGHDEQSLSFAVCDGVGQSFCGHLAAEFLGNALVKWMGELDAVLDEASLAAQATSFLNGLAGEGQRRVQEYPLPGDLSPLIRTALEQQRAYGSEAMFVCGRLSFPEDPTHLNETGRLELCWLGDTELQVFDRKGQPLDIGAKWTTDERWSTARGIKGADHAHVWIGDLGQVGRIIAYSDGLSSVAQRLAELVNTPEVLQQETERIYNSPGSDDISLVDIQLRAPRSPVLLPIENPWRLSSYELRWRAVQEARGYMIEEASRADFEDAKVWVTEDTFYHVKGQDAGDHCYRVRALQDAMHSESSDVQWVRTLPGADWLPVMILLAGLILAMLVTKL